MESKRASRMSFGQQVSSALSVTLFEIFPGLDGVREVVNLGSFRRRQDLPAVVQTPSC